MQLVYAIIAVVVATVVASVVTNKVTISKLKNDAESKLGNAEAKARTIIDDAIKTAEATKKESLLEVKEESIKAKNELERETKERRAELQRYEKRVLSKEEVLEKREKEIIKLRYGLGGYSVKTQREVAEVCGISRSYVSRIEKKAIEKLRNAMED